MKVGQLIQRLMDMNLDAHVIMAVDEQELGVHVGSLIDPDNIYINDDGEVVVKAVSI